MHNSNGARPGAIFDSAPRRAAAASSLALGLGLAALPGLAAAQAPSGPQSLSGVTVVSPEADYGEAKSQVVKLTAPLVDTPQSVTVVTRAELDDRAVDTLNDALRATPGISIGAGETSWTGNNIVLRGFTTRDDTYLDGLRDFGYYYRDPFDDEAIEVLKGPSSILFGRGSTGGVIEQDSKAPIQTQSFLTTQAEVGTDETHRLTGDANTPVGDGAGAFRLNAMVHENNVAGRDEAHGSRWGFAPSLLLNIDPATQFKLDYYHQYEHDRPDYGIPWFNGKPAPVPRNNFYGFSSDFLHTAVNMLTVGVTHQFSPDVQLSSRLRYSEGSREFRTSEGVVPTGTPASTPPDAIKLNRNEFSLFDDDRMWQEDTDLTARFATGVLRHSLVAGVEVGEEISDPSYIFFTGVPATTLIDPPSQVFSDTARYNRLAVATDSHFVGVYALDTIDIGSHLQLIGGLRWDRFASAFDAVAHASPTAAAVNSNFNHVDAMPSYRAAVIYKPIPSASLYFTYGTSFDPSTEGIDSAVSSGHSAAIAYAGLAPETSQSFEGGAKWNVNPRLLATAAVFDIDMNNVRIPSPTTSAFDVLGGNAVVRGFELEASGHLTDRLETRIGYAYLDSETTKSAPGGSLLGSPLIVTPKDTFNLVAEYRVLKQVAVGGDIQMTTDRLGMNTAASYQRAPGYAIGGLMARYTPNDRIKVQINIYNLTDAYYYDQPQSFHVIPGAGRSAKLTLSSKF